MQDIHIMIRDILRAHEESKLAVFVGSGVSANSGYKSWWQIVDRFNENQKYVNNGTRDYTDEEILKIPQFAFQDGEENYFRILEEEYNRLPDKTNSITDFLVRLRPNHIITTNYDRLIEFSINEQNIYGTTLFNDFSRYSRVINDSGMVCATKPHYLIKMHGDLEDRASIVLKEEDYLEYSANHTLIETFVKSLFVNHTILFVGYSLRDHNLKLIMSWVNRFAKETKENHKNYKYYYINAENSELSSFEKEYYESKNIFIIESSRIPDCDESIQFSDNRGENLYRTLKYIFCRYSKTLENVITELRPFEDMNTITPYELYSVLGYYVPHYCIDGIDFSWVNGYFRNQEIISELQFNKDSAECKILRTAFLCAGINGIAVNEIEAENTHYPVDRDLELLEIFWMQQERQYDILYLGDIDDEFYEMVISHNFVTMKQVQNKVEHTTQKHRLKCAFLHAYLWEDDDAKSIYRGIVKESEEANISFDYVVALYNLYVLDFDNRFRVLHENMADKHKRQFYTLLELFDGFSDLMRETIALDIKIRKMITINSISQSSDLNFTDYRQLRDRLRHILRYFINNHIFVMGLGGHRIANKWFNIIEIYSDITLRILSPNSKMTVSDKYKYERIRLKNEDIFFLTFYLEPKTLLFYIQEHNIRAIELDEKQQDYLLTLLTNLSRFDELPETARHSKLANTISCTMIIIKHTKLDIHRINQAIRLLEIILVGLLDIERDIEFTFFQECFAPLFSCLFELVKSTNDYSKLQCSIISLAESVLLHFSESNTENKANIELQIRAFEDNAVLRNLSVLLDYYFKETIEDTILVRFLDRAEQFDYLSPTSLPIFIIALYPIISDKMRERYKTHVYDNLSGIEIQHIQLALVNNAITYDSSMEAHIVHACHNRIQRRVWNDIDRHNDPLYIVLRLYEKGIIADLSPYHIFRGHYDFFDFVCFPEEFDYNEYDTNWGSWLTLEKYSSIAITKAFDIMKDKYESTMLNAPTELDKHIYYKHFHIDD